MSEVYKVYAEAIWEKTAWLIFFLNNGLNSSNPNFFGGDKSALSQILCRFIANYIFFLLFYRIEPRSHLNKV